MARWWIFFRVGPDERPHTEGEFTVKIIKTLSNRGKWTVPVQYDDGSMHELPCIHRRFTRGLNYNDPELTEYWHLAKWAPYWELLRTTKRAVLTISKVDPDVPRAQGQSQRIGYVDVFDIEDVEADEQGLRFRLVNRHGATVG
jgi:hypothetical protein